MKWYCPNCNSTAYTVDAKIPMHPCTGLAGLMAPLIHHEEKAKVVAVEREDYIAGENVQYDGMGRPIMSVVTTKDDSQDCVIYAPVAGIGIESKGE